MRTYLAQLSYAYEGNWNKIYKALQARETVPYQHIQEKYITVLDKEYPASLKELKAPPFVVFYKGDVSLLSLPKVTVVGSRNVCDYGKKTTQRITDVLKKRYVITSGLAKGVDAIAHESALNGGKTIAVVGHGLYYQYPYCNRHLYSAIEAGGLILSEFPFYTPVRKQNFPVRNRILAALGERLFVTQAALRSGTMLTVNYALEMDREIYSIPYPFDTTDGQGCNRLIDEGAQILYDFNQL